MQLKNSNAEVSRISVSSAYSSSTQGSGPDDCESLGDVYIWGEVWCDGTDGSATSFCSKIDVLLPKPLESSVVLDVHQISCGVRHAVLVTKQGEVFTWGEESGGRLGLGADIDICKPQLVELLASYNINYAACGEYHTCAVSGAGDLFTWGDGSYTSRLLGHGTDVSHWMPKRVSGPLEGVQVLSVACGTWHSALITLNGKLFTFGDGSFGALGHGNRESAAYPKVVETLIGLKTTNVACGVWHTAAIVEVTGLTASIGLSRKLFTWGDGDKYRLGHGDKEPRLIPTCVPSLIDYNFHQIACGEAMTIALTTSGHVFTMGSNSHGQLGNPQSDGKKPCLVQDRLASELVEDIACGSNHVAVLTSRSEVFTWGKGANGRLGHGDIDDRKTPTFVEALKDRHVKSISCGSNFTASICIHKWVYGADQSLCSGCRLPFGFTRKRRNCYNCGLVHCHACSSRKVLRATLAPTPDKPHRVCDSCFAKLKATETITGPAFIRKGTVPIRSMETLERQDREARRSKSLFTPMVEPGSKMEFKRAKQTMKSGSTSPLRSPQTASVTRLKEISFTSSLSMLKNNLKPIVTSLNPVTSNSRPESPHSWKPSPSYCTSPVVSKSVVDSLKKTNELLNQEVLNLQAQVQDFKKICYTHRSEPQTNKKKVLEAASSSAEESLKCTQILDVVKSLVEQLKDVSEKLPPDVNDNLTLFQEQAEALLNTHGSFRSIYSSESDQNNLTNGRSSLSEDQNLDSLGDGGDQLQTATVVNSYHVASPASSDHNESRPHQDTDGSGELEVTELFQPGVYITLHQLHSGKKVFKRIRFSKRRFGEQQAEDWWKKNKEKVFARYGYPTPGAASPTLR